jgi:uncharacterized protein
MAFMKKGSDAFGNVIETTNYAVLDPIVKACYSGRTNNLVLGTAQVKDPAKDLIYIGKVFESSPSTNMLGADVWLDITFPHVVYITGTRGSGKSFDLGVLIEGISQMSEPTAVQESVAPITSILIDTQNQFWTLKYPPNPDIEENRDQLETLKRWRIPPNSLANVRLWIPRGTQKLLGDELCFSIRPRDVELEDWCLLLGQDVYSSQGHIIRAALTRLMEQDFGLEDLINDIRRDSNWAGVADSSRNALIYKLEDYVDSQLFDRSGLTLEQLVEGGVCNVFMLRELRDVDKSLVTAIIAKILFKRMGEYHARRKLARFQGKAQEGAVGLPSRVWMLIDEAHVVAGQGQASPARAALIEYVKRGRDAGLSLVLATQQPSAVDDRILSQVNLSFNHRLTFQSDVAAAISRIPTKTISQMRSGGATLGDFGDMLRYLDAGDCFVGDHATSRAVLIKVRPRVTAHGGYSPGR